MTASSTKESPWRALAKAVLVPFGHAWARLLPDRAWSFEIQAHTVALPALHQPLRVVQLTDLHVGEAHRGAALTAWVNATLAQRPDLIVITGDVLEDALSVAQWVVLQQQLSRLHAPLGVFAVLGNHDHGSGQVPALRRVFTGCGIKELCNTQVVLRDDVVLAGVDDLWLGQPNLDTALKKTGTHATLLLCHNPDLLPQIATHPHAPGFTLCGHTHGGQIVLPLVGALQTGSDHGRRFLQGHIQDPCAAYVSRGLGTAGVPLRMACPAELTVLDFVPTTP